MKLFLVIFLVGLASAGSSNSTSIFPTETTTSTSTTNNSVAEYTITALPAVSAAPACVFNCLIPIGLADPSGCDDVTNDCACLSAPVGAAGAITDCISTVCGTTISSYGILATSLYQSYCSSIYGPASLSSASIAESSANAAAAASSSATAGSTSSSSGSAAAASPTVKSEASGKLEFRVLANVAIIFGALLSSTL